MNCECPICFDAIEGNKNKVITECGHCFHTNCLMTSVAHNGFGCPYCRTEMAQEVNEEESEYDDDEEEEELYAEDVLRGFRLFMANIEDEEQDEEDVAQERYEQQIIEAAEERRREHELDNGMTPEYIAQRLVLQGVGMIDLVKVLLLGHDEFDHRNEEFDRLDGEMFGKLRTIISNYER